MEDRSVLTVGFTEEDANALESTLDQGDVSVSVRALTEFTDLFDELCYAVVHCLLVAPTVDDTSAVDVAIGVSGMYPDLPIVVAGTPPAPVPEDPPATIVDADSVTDPAVVEALESTLSHPSGSAASRPPSRVETMLHSMFDQFPVHLYAKDEDARHLMVSRHNQEPTNLLGITDLEYDELPREHREAAFRDEMRVIENEDAQLGIEEFTDYIDSHTLTSKVPWYGPEGDVIGLVGHTQEITERKQREHATRRQHELLVKVALVAAHELRNELQVASGRLELVENQPEQIDVVEESQRRLAAIVDTVVELATEEREQSEEKKLWLSTLGREIWTTLDTEGAKLEVGEDTLMVADPEAVSLLVQVLLSNAVEHTSRGVTVTIGGRPDGFFVADDGDGIGVDPPERVFDAGVTTHDEGTGFGLYVARSIATDNDWTLSLGESDDGGARFDVTGVDRIE